jgi:hypothetical protein
MPLNADEGLVDAIGTYISQMGIFFGARLILMEIFEASSSKSRRSLKALGIRKGIAGKSFKYPNKYPDAGSEGR